jgi:uncharacterized membrane protein (DUF485 family)
MISMFSKGMDQAVERQFRKDPNGRLVFLPFGPKKAAYFVDSKADEEKIKALVKMYRSFSTLLSLMMYPVVYFPGWIVMFFAGTVALQTRLKVYIGIALFFMLIMLLFVWMLWSVYKETIQEMTASLTEVGPDLKDHLSAISPSPRRLQRVALACLFAVMVLAGGVAIMALTRYARPKVVCPPKGTVSSLATQP